MIELLGQVCSAFLEFLNCFARLPTVYQGKIGSCGVKKRKAIIENRHFVVLYIDVVNLKCVKNWLFY